MIHSRHGYDQEHPAPVRGPVAAFSRILSPIRPLDSVGTPFRVEDMEPLGRQIANARNETVGEKRRGGEDEIGGGSGLRGTVNRHKDRDSLMHR